MGIRRQISEIEGIADTKVAQILREIKAAIEEMSGRNPRVTRLKSINPNAVPAGLYNAVNDLITQLQGDTVSPAREPSTQPATDAIWFWNVSAGKMTWLTLDGGSLQIIGTTLDTLNGSGCLRGPGTAS